MNLLPLTTFIFSLLAGNMDMGKATSDVKGEIINRYKGLQVEEPHDKTESLTCHEDPSEEDEETL